MKKGIYLFLIIAAAFIVRLIGIQFGLPFIYHDDEPILVNYALAYGVGDLNPHFFNIAPLLTYLLFFLYGLFFAMGRLFGYFHNLQDFAYLYLNDPTIFYVIGRSVLGLFCGTASVAALYFLGKKYFNTLTGLLAAFFLAFNFLHVRDSHYLYFDIPLTLCVLIFFLKAYDLFKPAKKIDYIQIGALFGLAVSIKYQGISLLAPFVLILAYNFIISKDLKIKDRISYVIWSGSAFLAVAFVANPYLFLNISGFVTASRNLPYIPVSPLYHLKISLINGCGLFMVIFALAGMAWSLVRKNKGVIMAVYMIFYYLLITKATQPGERIVLPIIPIALLFAAFLAVEIYNKVKNRYLAAAAVSFLAIVLIYPSLVSTYYSDLLFLKEDTRTQAYKWIKENIRPGSRIALDATTSGFPRLEKSKDQIKELRAYFGQTSFRKPDRADDMKLKFMLDNPGYPENTYYIFYLRSGSTGGFLSIYPSIDISYAELRSESIDHAVLSGILAQDTCKDFVREVKDGGVLLKIFSPYKEGISRTRSCEVASVPAAAFMKRELRDRKSYGPYIEVYQVTK